MAERRRLSRVIHALEQASAWPGRLASWAVILIMVFTVLSVLFSQLRIGVIATWDVMLPLIGNRITLAGLTELQWHFFGLMVMLGGAYALQADRHIRVDIIYGQLGPRMRRAVDVLGDVVFLIPFCVVVAWLSLGYVERSYVTGERSDYGGLFDRYFIKSMIPIGLSLLALAASFRVVRNLCQIFGVIEIHESEYAKQEKQDIEGRRGA